MNIPNRKMEKGIFVCLFTFVSGQLIKEEMKMTNKYMKKFLSQC